MNRAEILSLKEKQTINQYNKLLFKLNDTLLKASFEMVLFHRYDTVMTMLRPKQFITFC